MMEDENGAGVFLMDYSYSSSAGYASDTSSLSVMLNLKNFVREDNRSHEKILSDGEWNYKFFIDRSILPETISLPDTEVQVLDMNTEEVSISLANIELTNTSLRFEYNFEEEPLHFSDQISAHLKNGQTICVNGGGGVPISSGATLSCDYQWLIPMNIEEISYIQIGRTQIFISDNQ